MPAVPKKPHPRVIEKALNTAKTVAGAARILKVSRGPLYQWMDDEKIERECRWVWKNAPDTDKASV